MGYQAAAARVQLRELQEGLRARVDAELAPPARESIADLQQHIAADEHLSPSQMAAYRHRVDAYRSSCPQDELPFGPGAA